MLVSLGDMLKYIPEQNYEQNQNEQDTENSSKDAQVHNDQWKVSFHNKQTMILLNIQYSND